MPRQYKPDPRCKKHISYKKEDIERALEDLRANKLSYRVAAAKYNIKNTMIHGLNAMLAKTKFAITALAMFYK